MVLEHKFQFWARSAEARLETQEVPEPLDWGLQGEVEYYPQKHRQLLNNRQM